MSNKSLLVLYLLSDGIRVNRQWIGWLLSYIILWALCRHLTSPIALMLCRWVPMIFWPVLLIRCRDFLSWTVHKARQFMMFPDRIISSAPP